MNIIPFFITGPFGTNGDIQFSNRSYMSSHQSSIYLHGCQQLRILTELYSRVVPITMGAEIINRWFNSEAYLYRQVKRLGEQIGKNDHLDYSILSEIGNPNTTPRWYHNRNSISYHHMWVIVADDLNRINNQLRAKQNAGEIELDGFEESDTIPLILAYNQTQPSDYMSAQRFGDDTMLNMALFTKPVLEDIIDQFNLYDDPYSFHQRNNYRRRFEDAYHLLHDTSWYRHLEDIPKYRNLNPQSTSQAHGQRVYNSALATIGPQPSLSAECRSTRLASEDRQFRVSAAPTSSAWGTWGTATRTTSEE